MSMVAAFARVVGMALLVLIGSALRAEAHNGAVAIAVPVEGIKIDGDLSDWPEGMRRYPLLRQEAGDRLKGPGDFQGTFRVGYHEQENALYIGVEVQDDSLGRQDNCEIYLSTSQEKTDSKPVGYTLWRFYGGPSGSNTLEAVEGQMQWGERVYRYEWRVDLGRLSKGEVHVHAGMVGGFDVICWDEDGEGRDSAVAWGRGADKGWHSVMLGDLVFVGADQPTGTLGGHMGWKDTAEGVGRAGVRIQSLSAAALWTQVECDRRGRFAVELPAGRYRVEAGFGGGERAADTVEVKGGSRSEVALGIIPPQGRVVTAGPGRVILAGPGRAGPAKVSLQQGVWQTFGASQGFSFLNISAILQDRQGYLWLATLDGGVSRYDGQQFKTFTSQDGLAANRVYSIAEDRAGPLWFGTNEGVSCYDGQQFKTFTSRDGLAGDGVFAIAQDRAGRLWFATDGGVSRYDGQQFKTFTSRDGLAGNQVSSILEDRAGVLWFGTSSGVSRYDSERFTTFTTKNGLVDNRVNSLLEDRAGHLWLGTEGGVSRYDGQRFTNFTIKDGLAHSSVRTITEDHEGTLWFGTWDGASRFDGHTFTTLAAPGRSRTFAFDDIARLTDRDVQVLLREVDQKDCVIALKAASEEVRQKILNNMSKRVRNFIQQEMDALGPGRLSEAEQVQFFIVQQALQLEQRGYIILPGGNAEEGSGHNKIAAMLEDREGSLWFGTVDNGLSRCERQGAYRFTPSGREFGNGGVFLLQDREGNLWFGTWDEGVSRYDGQQFKTFTTQDGLAGNGAAFMLEDRQENLWFGTDGGVSRYDGHTFTTFTTEDGLAANEVRVMLEDRTGRLWFGTPGGVTRYDGGSFTTFTSEDGLADNSVSSLAEDRAGNLWVGTERGVSRYDGERFTTFTSEDGLADDKVNALAEDQTGNLWLGTERGVSRYDGERFNSFTRPEELADGAVSSIVEDKEGHLWFGTRSGGVSRYDGLVFESLTKEDGLPLNQVDKVSRDQRDNIWITSGGILTRYQPGHTPPPIHLLSVVADRRYGPATEIRLPSPQRSLSFEFHGISFKTRPGRMAYVYRLQGYDEDWRVTREEQVAYEDLPRGDYTFEVKAVDRDLTYSETPATVKVTISLPYGQIALVGGLGLALVGLVIASGVAIRRRHAFLREQQARLQAQEQLNKELEDELRTAHDLQMGLMPGESPRLVGLDLAGRCIPANHVGGDLFQYFQQDGKLSIALADVTGHAMEAAIPMVMFSGILENQMEQGGTPQDLFARLNRSLHRTLKNRSLVCCVLAELDLSTRALRLASAAFPYPYHFRAVTGEMDELQVDAYPLGVRPDTCYEAVERQLATGDYLVFCSDGIIEAIDRTGAQFGYERTAAALRSGCAAGLSAEALLERIMGEVKGFRGEMPQGDDQTVVVLKVDH